MKKVFALVLAVAMVMSLAAVSFALRTSGKAGSNPIQVGNGNASYGIALAGPYKYDGDDHKMTSTTIQYGKSAYYLITYTGSGRYGEDAPLTDFNDIEKLKVKVKYEMGSDLVESVSIVKKNIVGGVATAAAGSGALNNLPAIDSGRCQYAYFVEVKTKPSTSSSDADIVATLTFNAKKNKDAADANFNLDDVDIDIAINVFYESNWKDSSVSYLITDNSDGTTNNGTLKPGTKYLLKFDYDDEVDLEFGLEPNEGTFTVDVSGQGKILVDFDTNANDAIIAANPTAKLYFVNFNNIKFNRTGEFAYESEDFEFVYEIKDGKLVTVPTAEYDAADETIYFNTRVLGSYVFSDIELVDAPEVPVEADETPEVAAPVENPGTGAAA